MELVSRHKIEKEVQVYTLEQAKGLGIVEFEDESWMVSTLALIDELYRV